MDKFQNDFEYFNHATCIRHITKYYENANTDDTVISITVILAIWE